MSISDRIENLRDFTLERNLGEIALQSKEEAFTYGDLELISRHMSTWFTRMGLKGEPVAFMLPNGFEIVITYLACFKSGAVAMPLNRRYAAPELEKALINSGAKCLIIELDKLYLLSDVDLTKTQVETVYLNGVVPRGGYSNFYTLLGPTGEYSATEIDADDPAVILYTSGSTGEPKGVVHSYASVDGILSSTSQALDDINENDRVLVMDPLVHISGFIETFSALYYGARAMVHEGFKIETCIPSFVNERPTLLTTHIDIYVKILESGLTNKDTFGSLRGIYTGGDALPSAFQQKLYDHSGLVLQLGYGMTEAIWLTIARELDTEGLGTIGEALPGVEIRLVDSEGNDVEDGKIGEIWVKGQMVTPGYWNNEKTTDEAITDGWFKTGDLAKRDSGGVLYYAGRIKDMIIRNTSNIMPGEVEEALYKSDDVKEAAVIGVEDAEEGHVPVAFVVRKEGSSLNEDELKNFCATQIAEYKTPARIYFIESMPLTSSGKINHKKLYDLV